MGCGRLGALPHGGGGPAHELVSPGCGAGQAWRAAHSSSASPLGRGRRTPHGPASRGCLAHPFPALPLAAFAPGRRACCGACRPRATPYGHL
eukprot:15442858-Alexandrium_andersonii.AAC.1